ncbi:DDE-type integrase/transposase/recombinase, partial [Hymenobacter terrestris]|uniref:DDE-type integrase/transposase/recombinase n=1 Tax=Hymenobacter terrestris TaxID=2748310 RepID=UPI001C409C75
MARSAGAPSPRLARSAAPLVCAPHHRLRPGRARRPQPIAGPARPTAPNRVWVGDITYLPHQGGGWLYLAVWLDLCSRKIVGWDVRESMPEDLVSEALR